MNQFEVNITTLPELFSKLKQFVRPGKRYLITLQEWDKRSLNANAAYHTWIKQISDYTGEDLKSVEARCKRDHGLPILLSGSHGVVTSWLLEKCHFERLDDSQQLKVISAMEVTRTFTTKEHNAYRNSIQAFWANHGLNLNYTK